MMIRFYNLCPNTDPSQLTFFNNLIPVSQIAGCAASLSSIDCTNELGFTSPGWTDNSTWVDPNALPQNGTQSLSNLPGSLTAPVSGTSLVWSLGSVLETAVASAAAGGGGSAKTTPTGGSGSGSGGGKSGTATASGSAATGSKSSSAAGLRVECRSTFALGVTFLWFLVSY